MCSDDFGSFKTAEQSNIKSDLSLFSPMIESSNHEDQSNKYN